MIDPALTITIRLYCDGELSPDETRLFERRLETDVKLQQAVVFERTLRRHLDTVLSVESTKAPPTLAARIRQSLADEAAPAPLKFESPRSVEPAQPTWRINYLTVAAVITLVIGAVIFGIVFPQIDTIQSESNGTEFLASIGSIVASEHDRFAGNRKLADETLTLNDPVDTADELSRDLHSRVTPIDLSELGYEFYGAATCGALPCGGPSGHMLFKKRVREDGTLGGPNISLFFVPEGRLADYLDYKLQRRWVKNNDPNTKCGHEVFRLDYPETGLVYFLVTCDPAMLEPASQLVLKQLHASCRP